MTKTMNKADMASLAYNRGRVLYFTRLRAHADGWTRPASNPSWIEAARTLEEQGVIETAPAKDWNGSPAARFRIRPEFDG